MVSGFHYDDGTGDTLGMGYGFRTGEIAGDADGDGLPNVLFILSRESTTGLDSTACALVLGPGIPDGNLAGSELAQICTLDDPADGSEAASYPIAWTNDIDGDGGAELMVSRDTGAWSYEYNTCVVRSSIVALGGVIDALDPAFVPGPCYVYDGSIDRPLWIDMTGDGLSDMIYGQNDYDDPTYGDRAGRIVVVDGFEIPWNDPSKW